MDQILELVTDIKFIIGTSLSVLGLPFGEFFERGAD